MPHVAERRYDVRQLLCRRFAYRPSLRAKKHDRGQCNGHRDRQIQIGGHGEAKSSNVTIQASPNDDAQCKQEPLSGYCLQIELEALWLMASGDVSQQPAKTEIAHHWVNDRKHQHEQVVDELCGGTGRHEGLAAASVVRLERKMNDEAGALIDGLIQLEAAAVRLGNQSGDVQTQTAAAGVAGS